MHRSALSLLVVLVVALCGAEGLAQDLGDAGVDGGEGDSGPVWPEECPDEILGCYLADVDWLHRDALFDDVDWDTGWVPAGSPIQLRFGLALGGETEVELGGSVVTSWPPALNIAVPGRPGAGRLSMNYGFELIARLRFDVEVAGVRYDWEGDIPIPFIPEDLRLAGDAFFDPFLLPGGDERPVWVSDSTDVVRVFRIDALDAIIPIPGVGGGFLVALQGNLDAGYQTEVIDVADALPIVGEGEHTRLDPLPVEDPDAPGGYGPSAQLLLHPEGTLFYEGQVMIIPEFYLEVVGTRFDYPLAEIPVDLVDLDNEVIFDDAEVEVPLPDVDVQPARLDLGWGYIDSVSAQPLVFVNNGDAPLVVAAESLDSPFSMDPPMLVIEPHRTERVSARFRPVEEGDVSVMFEFSTNDPDEPSLLVLLEGEGRARAVPDAGPVDAGPVDADLEPDAELEAGPEPVVGRGCECSAGGAGQSSPAVPLGAAAAILLALLVLRSPRRR